MSTPAIPAVPTVHDAIVLAPKPPQPLDKGLAGPGLLAHVITSKYADHLPLYRQEGILARSGVDLSRSTLADWMRQCAELLTPLYTLMLARVLQSKVVHLDETRLPVQASPKTHSGRLWGYVGDRTFPYVVYDYRPDKSRAGPEQILKDYQGYLQADAANVFDGLYRPGGIVEVGCWAHARRHFHDAQTSDRARAVEAMARIRLLYQVEAEAREQIAQEELSGMAADDIRLSLRKERATPVLASLHAWLKEHEKQALPKSPFGKAIAYTLNHWEALKRYTEQGYLDIDNNEVERSFRAVALGRHNFLFVGNDDGGRTAAVLYSFTQTCKLHTIDPFAYLRDVLTRLPTQPADKLEELLPKTK